MAKFEINEGDYLEIKITKDIDKLYDRQFLQRNDETKMYFDEEEESYAILFIPNLEDECCERE